MAQTKNLCAQVPIDLHALVCEAREAAGQTTSEYITQLLMPPDENHSQGEKSHQTNLYRIKDMVPCRGRIKEGRWRWTC